MSYSDEVGALKCPHCGAENIRSIGPCHRCGKPVERPWTSSGGIWPATGQPGSHKTKGTLTPSVLRNQPVPTEDMAKRMSLNYQYGSKEQPAKAIEGMLKLLAHLRKSDFNLRALMDEAANLIHSQFRLRWVAIGLKDPADGKFRYESLVGFREDAEKMRRAQTFVREDFFEQTKYKGWTISEYTRIYFEEDTPYTEGAETTFNRPVLLKARKRGQDEALEGDYLDIHIYGHDNELLGWIEVSGTVLGKLPDIATIKIMEMIASIIGAGVLRTGHQRR